MKLPQILANKINEVRGLFDEPPGFSDEHMIFFLGGECQQG